MSRRTTLSGTEASPLSDAATPWRRLQNTDVPRAQSRGHHPWPGVRRAGRGDGAARRLAGSHQDCLAGYAALPRECSDRRSSAHRLDEGACPDDATIHALGRAYPGSPVHPGIAGIDNAGRGLKEDPRGRVSTSGPTERLLVLAPEDRAIGETDRVDTPTLEYQFLQVEGLCVAGDHAQP